MQLFTFHLISITFGYQEIIGHAYLPWISFLLALLLDLQSMAEKK